MSVPPSVLWQVTVSPSCTVRTGQVGRPTASGIRQRSTAAVPIAARAMAANHHGRQRDALLDRLADAFAQHVNLEPLLAP